MPNGNKKVYEVFEASNGYFAQLASGRTVIGKTLAEVTTEANAAVTEEMTSVNTGPTPDDPLNQKGWQKGLLENLLAEFDLSNGAKVSLFKGKPPAPWMADAVSGAGYARGGVACSPDYSKLSSEARTASFRRFVVSESTTSSASDATGALALRRNLQRLGRWLLARYRSFMRMNHSR